MKRILTVFPAVICLILSLCVPLCASAETDPESGTYYPLEQFKTDNLYTNQSYLYFTSYFPNNNRTDSFYLQVLEEHISSVEENDGVYSVSFDIECTLNRRCFNYGSFDSADTFSVRSFKYDSNNKTFVFYSSDNFTSVVWIPGDDVFKIYQVDTNIFDTKKTDDLKFEFFPELTGEVDYKRYTVKGVELKDYQYFEFDVTNTSSRYSYQYSFFIVDKDQKITFDSVPISDADSELGDSLLEDYYYNGKFFSNSPIFTYITEEWAYSSFGGGLLGSPKLCLSPTSWHLVKPGETKHVSIDWRQIKLEPGRSYDCVAVACKKDCALENVDYNDYVVNFISSLQAYNKSQPFDAYRSSFTVKSATPYDPSVTYTSDDGTKVYGYNPDTDNSSTFNQLFASKDDEHGYTRVEGNFSTFDPSNPSKPKPSGGSSGNGSGSFGSSGTFGDFSVTSFSGMFSRVFGGVSMFMGYLPASIMNIFIFGFSCVVVIAIIKAVR